MFRYEFTVAMHLVYRALQEDMIPDQVANLPFLIKQGYKKFLLSCLLGKNIKLWRKEGNIMAVRKNITWKKGKW